MSEKEARCPCCGQIVALKQEEPPAPPQASAPPTDIYDDPGNAGAF